MKGLPAGCGGGKAFRKSVTNVISTWLIRVGVYEWFTFCRQYTVRGIGVIDMPFKEPFILGPFSVDSEGRLAPARQDVAPGFSIRWRGRFVHARLLQSDQRDGRLYIQSSLGRMPSTASDPAVRVACFEMLRNLLSSLPEHWSASLLPDHQPQLEVETSVDLPITVINLVTELTLFLLVLSPYLDLMDQAGVGLVTTQPVSPCPT
jgi:hypothetical protein